MNSLKGVFMKLKLIAAAFVAVLGMYAAKPTPEISLNGSDWQYLGTSSSVGRHPVNLSTGGWFFNLPVYDDTTTPCWDSIDCSWFGYAFTPYKIPIRIGSTVSVRIQVNVTGSPEFRYQTEEGNTCVGIPTSVRFLVIRGNSLRGAYDRWWSNPARIDLGAGPATLSVPVDPALWSSVYGEFGTSNATALAGFNAAMSRPSYVGLTGGGGCFFGHGIFVRGGTAQFQLLDYKIQ